MPKVSPIRKSHEIDATGKAVGRLAAQVAILLRGKNKTDFDPSIDAGDSVVINHASLVKFTGRKLVQKDYYSHTMFRGGLTRTPMKKVFEKDPAEVIRHAVNGMLPKNRQRNNLMRRLTIHV